MRPARRRVECQHTGSESRSCAPRAAAVPAHRMALPHNPAKKPALDTDPRPADIPWGVTQQLGPAGGSHGAQVARRNPS